MEYREVYRKVCNLAAEHLCSLEVYDEFDDEDEDRVSKAIEELQRQLRKKGERTCYTN